MVMVSHEFLQMLTSVGMVQVHVSKTVGTLVGPTHAHAMLAIVSPAMDSAAQVSGN